MENQVGEKVYPVKKKRVDAKVHVNPRISQSNHDRLKRIAIACDFTKTSMAAEFINLCLNNQNIIEYFLQKYNKNKHLSFTPTYINGEMVYREHGG
ncbi:hypothetical protein BEP19_15760 [Ammoniphilus oxalaticus]|uniref:Uncharacterized protein n=1 Tax=Ammoniphilus oxalaticus TaxID=66863 RepID=A0A419SDV6_9BACL|nr:hypothetical protein [Ammoniphilus oxalaticus]RKD21127.1 hypothetical protein BEP19_15760 [Ammoniphilus oxalaticus]